MKIEPKECEILKTAFIKEGASHDIMSGGVEGGRTVNVTMTFSIVWMRPLSCSSLSTKTPKLSTKKLPK